MKAQASIEFLIIVALVLFVIFPTIYFAQVVVQEQRSISETQIIVNKISDAVKLVDVMGPGAMKEVFVYVPPDIDENRSYIEDGVINYGVFIEAGTTDIFDDVKACVNGTLPTLEGYYRLYISYQLGCLNISYEPIIPEVIPTGCWGLNGTCNESCMYAYSGLSNYYGDPGCSDECVPIGDYYIPNGDCSYEGEGVCFYMYGAETHNASCLQGSVCTVEGEFEQYTSPYEFEPNDANYPSMIHINNSCFAIAYTGPLSDGWIKTMRIYSNGTFIEGDSYEFDISNGVSPDLIRVDNGYFAVAYTGVGSDGYVITLNITDDCSIQGVVDSYEFDELEALFPDIIHTSGDYYLIAYAGKQSDGYLVTVDINGAGSIGGTIDSFEFDTDNGQYPRLIQILGDTYAMVYSGLGNDGWIITFNVTNGIISPIIDSFEFDTNSGTFSSIVNIHEFVYAIAYERPGIDGYIVSIEIFDNGTIKKSVVDGLQFDQENGETPEIIHINGSLYGIAYKGVNQDGFFKTLKIYDNGTFTNIIDTLEFDPVNGLNPFVLDIESGIIAITYSGEGGDGFITLSSISTVDKYSWMVTGATGGYNAYLTCSWYPEEE